MDIQNHAGSQSLLELSQETLEQITLLAECQMGIEEIAAITGNHSEAFLLAALDDTSAIYKAIKKGRLKAKAAIYKSIMDCAKAGSHPAQQIALKLIRTNQKQDGDI